MGGYLRPVGVGCRSLGVGCRSEVVVGVNEVEVRAWVVGVEVERRASRTGPRAAVGVGNCTVGQRELLQPPG